VIGAGVSGLVAARELDGAGHDVTVLEAGPRAGGHSNTVVVEDEAGSWSVDTGFIVLNDRNYPNFERLLAELGVQTQPADMSFGVSDGRGRFEWSTRGPRGVFACGANLLDHRFHRMLLDLPRFFRDARGLIGAPGGGPGLSDFLAERGYSEYFAERMIGPQVSAVWSADPARLGEFPAGFLAEFLDNHGALQLTGRPRWRTIPGGSRRYVERLTAPLGDRLRLAAPVREVRRLPGGVRVATDAGAETYDDVVIATHSDVALRMLADPSPAEREVLGAIPYQPNEAVLHTDKRLLPRRRAAWASWNFHLVAEEVGRTTVTYDMNRLQSLAAERRYLVTLNRGDAIDPGKVIRRIPYAHPVFSADGLAAQDRWAEVSGARRTHYCGAYWRWGFHEDGVWSALRAVDRLGALERGRRLVTASEPAMPVAA
jgi:predicted NAD/FAD-binding protein